MKPSGGKQEATYAKIWRVVEKVPRGKVATYGQIARIARLPGQARLVGYALHGLPHGIEVPWHRIINSKGSISFPPHSDSYRRQRRLLEEEGVRFAGGKLDLKRFGWKK